MDEPKLNSFAVIGNPVAHSMSPYIHQCFAKQLGVELSYEKIVTDQENFQQCIEQFFAVGGRGLNITTPFKSLAAIGVNSCSPIAQACSSVNTIYKNELGKLQGESTDGIGWLADIKRLDIVLANKKILVVGAGGAARIIINRLLEEQIQRLHICNRTAQKALALITNDIITASGLNDIPEVQWDLVINTLPVGWQDNYPKITALVADETVAYDLNYGVGAESFKAWFVAAGGDEKCFSDGWGMLVEQAAESFNLWWKFKPTTAELINHGPLA